ncbi:MAG: LPS export ABC transporter periplasmic protein LptC [cyanobacterium endosymbiont of Rhopalodia musculus]|uniref:LPS export ABC transporter periplasmic protein LptC n=1 Tax=cyanobacterium endosymbiont of Epithemia clementina EcSB TaxID=3034674 RepID=UPI0024809D64|nr:LPS export ABC transporter periplasmic protein LptC [cyanobacterium endosymbiont of Epithemia clementina EcSB]WGT66870.1 LPS export ABC transporter periplasmic protein LptC [cyanobacterium endosymbiont of Epithemia clementina EcSB]
MDSSNFLQKQHLQPNWVLTVGVLFLLSAITACQGNDQSQNSSDNPQQKATNIESQLILNNATLEQSNAKGEMLWKIQVDEAVYSPDRKKAQLTAVKGNIFQDGKIVLRIKADQGEIDRDGQEIYLKENIVAVDPRNDAVIQSEEVEWRPRESVLMIRKNLRGSHPQFTASAKEGKYYATQQKLEFIGNIIATSKKPRMQLKTEHLLWKIPEQKVIGDRLLNIVRFQDKIVTDKLVANRAEVHLNTKQIIVKDNIEFKSIKPPVQVATNEFIWKYEVRQVTSSRPVKLIHYQQGVIVTGNQAEVDLTNSIAYLRGGVQGNSTANAAKLYSNDLTWNVDTQIIEALGNVIYEQTNPDFNLTGEKAVGTIHDNKIVVSGNAQDRVVTEFFPNK